MMTEPRQLEQSYASACLPERWTIFGVTLQPITLGHRLILLRLGNPISGTGEIKVGDIIQAVWLCSMPYSEAVQRIWEPLSLRWKLWATFVQMTAWFAPEYALSRLKMVSEFIRDSMETPEVWSRARAGEGEASSPEVLLMKRVLMNTFGYTEREVLSLPLSQVQWECVSALESTGAVRFITNSDKVASELLGKLTRGELVVTEE